MKQLHLPLSPEVTADLERLRRHATKPYLRERATAVLKVAAGTPAAVVARTLLYVPRRPGTVRKWCHAVGKHGAAGLLIEPGRGRERRFSAAAASSAAASSAAASSAAASSAAASSAAASSAAASAVIRGCGERAAAIDALANALAAGPPPGTRDPARPASATWTLAQIRDHIPHGFRGHTSSGMWHYLKALGFSRQRHRAYIHSPGGDYDAELALVRRIIAEDAAADRALVMFADAITIYNHAACGYDYARAGASAQPRAKLALEGERTLRVAGAIDIGTGAVVTIRRAKIETHNVVRLLSACEAHARERGYERGYERAIVIWDNWPVHRHPDVVAQLEPQRYAPFGYRLPRSWAAVKPSAKAQAADKLAVQVVSLPTYAPWLNPIERFWKWIAKQYLYGHRDASRFQKLKDRLEVVFEQLTEGSAEVLSYIGLQAKDGIYAQACESYQAKAAL